MIGINLLREGLDLPEVKLVAVLDADKQGFLRSKSSLIQTVGRAARNSEGYVIFMQIKLLTLCKPVWMKPIEEDQVAIIKNMVSHLKLLIRKCSKHLRDIWSDNKEEQEEAKQLEMLKELKIKSLAELERQIIKKRKEMEKAASDLEFEKAAELRDPSFIKRSTLAYGE